MVELMENKGGLLASFARSAERRDGDGLRWLRSIREAALDRFTLTGFPTTRDEEWRFTNVAPIAKTAFGLPDAEAGCVTVEQVRGLAVPGLAGWQLVFVNGHFAARLSSLSGLPRGVRVMPLAEALPAQRELIQPHLDGHALHAARADAFTWLNTAFVEDGAFIHVPRGIVLEQPIQVLSIATPTSAPVMTHPRNIIIADECSQFTVIERYAVLDGASVYLTNAITDVLVGENATVSHYLLEEESAAAFNISTLRSRQMGASNFASHTVLLGGKLVRNNVHAILDGEGCECLINGLFVGSDSQHMDNHMRVEHAQPHGDSRQFYKGILDDRASGVFSGRIIVHPGAQKTDAKQTSKNLLLSDDAHVDTQPQLEIHADDVKCTHGATIGQLDDEAVFYLRARGIAEDAARSLLIHAFGGESLGRMKIESIRAYLDKILLGRLPGGELLEHMLDA